MYNTQSIYKILYRKHLQYILLYIFVENAYSLSPKIVQKMYIVDYVYSVN
jgi:hypothetical protein